VPKIVLTATVVARAKPDPGVGSNPTFYWDSKLGGFALSVAPSGRKVYVVQYRARRVSRRMTIGKADRLTVDEARKLARKYLSEVDHGRDPMEEKRAQERASKTTFRAVALAYLEDLAASGKRSVEKYRSYLHRLILPEFGAWQVADVRRSHVRNLLRRIARDHGPAAADFALAVVRGVLNAYALDADNYRPPAFKDLKQTPVEELARTRTLSDDELHAVWRAAECFPTPWGAFVRFLLLTACRRTEAASATWSEIEAGVWTIKAARYKTKTEVRLPLSKTALGVLSQLPRIEHCPFIFTPDGRHPITGFSEFKAKFDAACGVRDWRLHDLRRTSRTLLSRAGVLPDVAERCLGHKIGGIRGVYDQHRYEQEMLSAFGTLAAQIERIVDPQPNVVPLGKGRP
jgi:integrase